jgi:hypothetical protein
MVFADGFSVTESVDKTLADGNTTAVLPTAQVTTAKEGIFYAGKPYQLDTPYGVFYSVSHGTEDSNSVGIHPQTHEAQTLVSLADPLNKIMSVPPFKGSLPEYVQLLLDLTGTPCKKRVFWAVDMPPWTIRGYYGNVFEHLNMLCTYKGYEVVYSGKDLIVRPKSRYIIDSMSLEDAVRITYQRGEQPRYVDVSYYPAEWKDAALAWPTSPTDETKPYIADSVMSVNNKGTDDDISETTVDIDVSLIEIIRQSVDPAYPDAITCSLPLAILYNSGSGSLNVLCYLNRLWKPVGVKRANDASTPTLYTSNAYYTGYTGIGDFSRCTANNVLYRCTVASDGSQNALWVPWAQVYGSTVTGAAALATFEQKFTAPPYSYYTVTGSDDMPIMPDAWTGAGGRLEVIIEDETDRITFRLTGADIHYDVPIYSDPSLFPSASGSVSTVAFDLSGHFTESTMYYVAQGGVWAYDDTIEPFPYAPYRICVSSGQTDYNGMYVVGKGVAFTREMATWENNDSQSVYDEKSRTSVDMRFVDSPTEALAIGARSLRPTFTATANLRVGDGIILRNYFKDSYDGVLDFMFSNETPDNPYSFDDDSFDTVTQWWKNYLKKTNFTFDNVAKAVDEGAYQLFGNLAGAVLDVPNRGTFRVLEANISSDGLSLTCEEDTRIGDLNRITGRLNKDMTLGDLDLIFSDIELKEHLGTYTLGMLGQEPGRQVV